LSGFLGFDEIVLPPATMCRRDPTPSRPGDPRVDLPVAQSEASARMPGWNSGPAEWGAGAGPGTPVVSGPRHRGRGYRPLPDRPK